jgi:hypothetical protein
MAHSRIQKEIAQKYDEDDKAKNNKQIITAPKMQQRSQPNFIGSLLPN